MFDSKTDRAALLASISAQLPSANLPSLARFEAASQDEVDELVTWANAAHATGEFSDQEPVLCQRGASFRF